MRLMKLQTQICQKTLPLGFAHLFCVTRWHLTVGNSVEKSFPGCKSCLVRQITLEFVKREPTFIGTITVAIVAVRSQDGCRLTPKFRLIRNARRTTEQTRGQSHGSESNTKID
jgi:hypothetical protein